MSPETVPISGWAKCSVRAAFEPPAETPQMARKAPLRQSANPRKEPGRCASVGYMNGGKEVYAISREYAERSGESVSRSSGISLNISARKRYVFASGDSKVPR